MKNIKQGGLWLLNKILLNKAWINFILTCGYELLIIYVFIIAIILGFMWG